MGINIGQASNIHLPDVPKNIGDEKVLYEYMQKFRREIMDAFVGLGGNDQIVFNAVNSGTSGTFTLSSGGSIIITSGIVITVTS